LKTNFLRIKKLLFFYSSILVLSFFLVSSVYAEDSIIITSKDIGRFKPNQQVTLIQTCQNCSYVNLTGIYSRSASNFSLLGEFVMIKNGTVYSYIPTIQLSQGEYSYCTKGDVDGTIETQCVNFTIGRGIMIPSFLIVLGILFLALGIYNREYLLGFASGTFLSMAGVYVLIYGLGSFNDLYTRTIAYVSLFMGLIISFASAYEVIPFGEGGDSDED
jgi:hypothetical protein